MRSRALILALLLLISTSTLAACGDKDKSGEDSVTRASDKKTDSPEASLEGFMEKLMEDHDFSSLMPIDKDTAAELYLGLGDIPVKEEAVYMAMISDNTTELALIQVENAEDASAVAELLEARIREMIEGGASYPSSIERWEQDSDVVTAGSYVMLVVHPDHEAIIEEFNAAFK